MRDFEKPGRSLVVARQGMAATSHPSATLAAVRILAAGGNATDAAIAACAVQCVVEPGSTGIGGDCFALISREGSDEIVAYNGSGRAPSATAEWFAAQGLSAIDGSRRMRSRCRARSTPGRRLHADHGKLPFAEVLAPAIRFAEEGYAISPRVHRDWLIESELLVGGPATHAVSSCLADARRASARCIASRSLAATLRRIAARRARRLLHRRGRRRHRLLPAQSRRRAYAGRLRQARRRVCRSDPHRLPRPSGP